MKHSLKKTLSIILVAAIMICSASLTGLADNVKEEISTHSSVLVAPNYGAIDRYKNPVWTEENPCPTVIAKDENLSDDWFVYGLRWRVKNDPEYTNPFSYIKHYIIANGGDFGIIYADEKFSPYVGTGSVIDAYGGSDNGDNSENCYIVIFGDVNGDSMSTAYDVAMIESEMKGITQWSDPESEEYEPYKVKASDMDKNGKIDLYDYCVISSIVLGVYFVDQRTGAFFDDNESLYTLIYYYDTEPYNDVEYFQLESGAEIEELPETPEKEGCVFNGWIDYETGEPLESVMPARDVVAYPSWITEGCQHDYILTETISPTCTGDGIETYTCTKCGYSYTKSIPTWIVHKLGDWEVVIEPTCIAEGVEARICESCGAEVETRKIPVSPHIPTEWVVIKVPTCVKEGLMIRFCMNCDAVLSEETIPATGHDSGKWITAVAPTCTEKGEKVLACTVCDAVLKTMEIPELGHVAPEPEPKPPVCGVETFNILCVRCGLQEIVFIPHDPGEWVVISEPTETTPGMEVCCCEICGEVLETREISPLEHTHKKRTVTIPATCTVAGMEYDICETCGERIGEAKVLPATGHKPGSWIVSIEPDCENDGEKIRNCSVCGAVCETKTIPANGHIPGEWETVMESTAETEGLRIKKCVVCGDTVEEEIIPKKTVLTDDGTGVGIEIDSGDYDGEVEIVVSETFDGSAFNLVNTETEATRSMIYDIKITVDGEEVQPNGKVRVRIPLPEGYDESRTFVYHVDTSTGIVEGVKAAVETINGKKYLVFETTHFSYYAVVEECGFTMEICNPSTTKINYGDSIILHADIEGKLPAGYTVRWSASNSNFSYKADGTTCEISPEKSGDTVFTATIYDSSGKEVIKDEQTMTSKAGFFQKIIAFFKRIFGLTKIYPNVLGL